MCLYIVHYFIAIYTKQKTTKIIKNKCEQLCMILLQTFNFCLFFFSLYLGLGIYIYSPGCLRVLLIMSLLFREQVKLKDRMFLGEKNLSVLNHL